MGAGWSGPQLAARPALLTLFGQDLNYDLSSGLKLQDLLWLSEDFYLAKGQKEFRQSEVFPPFCKLPLKNPSETTLRTLFLLFAEVN